jgi:hypothetical protein
MKSTIAASLAFLSTVALAQSQAVPTFPVPLSEQDTTNIRQVCDIARASGLVNLETALSVARYCVDLIGRVSGAEVEAKKLADAEAKKAAEPKKDEPKK